MAKKQKSGPKSTTINLLKLAAVAYVGGSAVQTAYNHRSEGIGAMAMNGAKEIIERADPRNGTNQKYLYSPLIVSWGLKRLHMNPTAKLGNRLRVSVA